MGCPPPTEIDCILTTKVYDFCFQTDTLSNLSFTIPSTCPSPLPIGAVVTGTVTGISCTTVSSTPILNPTTGAPTGFADVTVLITVTVTFVATSSTGVVLCTFDGTTSFMKTVVLCAPSGTSISCETPSSAVGPVAVVDGTLLVTVTVCVLLESLATVKLLVPSYGFCTPAPCVVAASPPVTCPPSPLYPPQCVVPTP